MYLNIGVYFMETGFSFLIPDLKQGCFFKSCKLFADVYGSYKICFDNKLARLNVINLIQTEY
ncbi:MAG: hypothetical protein ACJAXF_001483 [Polaribacter sp.]|jgi:hypothetical protein